MFNGSEIFDKTVANLDASNSETVLAADEF